MFDGGSIFTITLWFLDGLFSPISYLLCNKTAVLHITRAYLHNKKIFESKQAKQFQENTLWLGLQSPRLYCK